MAEVVIDVVESDELPEIVEMFNHIIRPPRELDVFRRRFQGRHNVLQLIARRGDAAVGFFLGYEIKPDTYYAWFYGVLPDERRSGVGSQLMEAAQEWAAKAGYETFRLECYNEQRPMLHLAIQLNYNIVGIRWDVDRNDNLIMFEKTLAGLNS